MALKEVGRKRAQMRECNNTVLKARQMRMRKWKTAATRSDWVRKGDVSICRISYSLVSQSCGKLNTHRTLVTPPPQKKKTKLTSGDVEDGMVDPQGLKCDSGVSVIRGSTSEPTNS
ncbi:hypothetical protein AA313_de0206621 [Arthrobotrys entomopaga]|nr:hypothetical protein AA313_de0206621 [Arthrobotrys entomopaga]